MVVTNWLRLFRGRLWFHHRIAPKPRPRRRPIGLARQIEVYEDRTLLSAVAIDDAYMTGHGQPVSADVSLNDDMGGGGASFSEVSGPAHGTLSFNADGTFVYTPDAQFVGSDQFVYAISEGTSSDEGTVTIDVLNSPPSAEDDSFFTSHNQSIYENVATNDSDGGDGDPVTYSVLAGPAHGALTFNPDGTFEYTPEWSFVGDVQFTYEISDSFDSDSAIATISLFNSPPSAEDDSFFTPHRQTIGDTVAPNDFDGGDGDPVTFSLVTGPSHGNLTFNPDGTFSYAPGNQFVGDDQFVYEISDGIDADSATVTVSVFNMPPIAAEDWFDAPRGELITGSVAPNDFDGGDGDAVTYSLLDDVLYGVLTFNPDGTFEYTSDTLFVGSDQFRYQISDGIDVSSAVAHISVFGDPMNGDVDAVDDSFMIHHGWVLIETVSPNDTLSVNGGPTQFTLVADVSHGQIDLQPDGYFTYTPDQDFAGTDQFTYRLNSGGDSDEAVVTIDVSNTPPTAEDAAFETIHDRQVDGSLGDYVDDPDGDPLTFSVKTPPEHGSLTLNADGTFIYQPDWLYVGEDSFEYEVTDGVSSASAKVTIEMTNRRPVADSFLAPDNEFTVLHDNPLTERVTATDPDGDNLTFNIAREPLHGTVVMEDDGWFTYTPDYHFVGWDSFLYYAFDGIVDDTATVSIHVINHEPFAVGDAAATIPLQPVSGNVLANDIDPDGDPLTASLVSGPSKGQVTLSQDGTFTYEPFAGMTGGDVFTYEASDGLPGGVDRAEVAIMIVSPGDGGTGGDGGGTGGDGGGTGGDGGGTGGGTGGDGGGTGGDGGGTGGDGGGTGGDGGGTGGDGGGTGGDSGGTGGDNGEFIPGPTFAIPESTYEDDHFGDLVGIIPAGATKIISSVFTLGENGSNGINLYHFENNPAYPPFRLDASTGRIFRTEKRWLDSEDPWTHWFNPMPPALSDFTGYTGFVIYVRDSAVTDPDDPDSKPLRVVVNLNNVNESPWISMQDDPWLNRATSDEVLLGSVTLFVDPRLQPGTVIADFLSHDQDLLAEWDVGTHTWSIDDPSNTFSIDSTTGVVTLDSELRLAFAPYVFDVTVTDGAGASTTLTVNIQLDPANFEVSGPGWIDVDKPEVLAIFELDPDLDDYDWAEGTSARLTLGRVDPTGSFIPIATRQVNVHDGWAWAKWTPNQTNPETYADLDLTAGTKYRVQAEYDGRTVRSSEFVVVTGEPAAISIDLSADSVAADGKSTVTATATIRDVAGNPVVDGTLVSWDDDGMALIAVEGGDGNVGTTIDGRSTIVITTTEAPGVYRVTARAGQAFAERQVNGLPVEIHLSTYDSAGNPANTLDLTWGQTLTVKALVTDSDGNPLPGIPVRWWDQKGILSASQDSVTDAAGVATAVINPQIRISALGRDALFGVDRIVAKVAGSVEETSVSLVVPGTEARIQIDEPVLASDKPVDGSHTVTLADGTEVEFTYEATEQVRVQGLMAGQRIRASVVNSDPNPDPDNDPTENVLIGDTPHSTEAIADSAGTAAFNITSRGTETSQYVRYVTIRVEQIDSEGNVVPGTIPLEHRVALAPSARIVQLKMTLGLFWRLASGVALGPDSLDEVAADVTLSFTPYVGVYPDLRDAAVNLARFVPGGEEPSKWELSLALLGIVGEVTVYGDFVLDVLRPIVRFADHSRALWRTLDPLIRDGIVELWRAVRTGNFAAEAMPAFNRLLDHKELLQKMVLDPEYMNLVQSFLVKKADHLADLNQVSKFLGADEAATLLKQLANAAEFDPERAASLVAVLPKLLDDVPGFADHLANFSPLVRENLLTKVVDVMRRGTVDATEFAKAVKAPAKHGLLTTADDFRTFVNQLDDIADAGNFGAWFRQLGGSSAKPEFVRGRLYELTVASSKALNGGGNLAIAWDFAAAAGKSDVDILLAGGKFIEAKSSAQAFKSANAIRKKLRRLQAAGATEITFAVPSAADIPQRFWDVLDDLARNHGFPREIVSYIEIPQVFG